ncbi:DUF541 domain-containing protein [Skermania sp. ID1734]|uniref:SIMPL domain-containing protein n=1 Tax=Skermania sp. ID1734 TaxID=2597516 RepID=UPI00117F03CA|nr:SIMPL domain-containing protein [Skermania sp. ID1734]TSD99978.1 DUF541 domain-containing protein [Skermania sp. ID1734]
MPRRYRFTATAIGAAAAATVSLLLAGCSSDDDNGASTHEVTVVGSGEVTGAPDILNADVGVSTTAADVSGAVEAANQKAKAMIDAVVNAGVARSDVQTSELSIQPEYNNPAPGGTSTVSGYRATNSVHITVRDLTKASKVLDAAVKAGGNDARLGGVSFAIDDNSKLLADARKRAFEDAKNRAKQYADLSGLPLGKVIDISETSSGGPTPMPRQNGTMNAAPDMPIEPGTQKVHFDVTVKWALG